MTKESYNFGVDTEAKRLYTETSGMTAKRFIEQNLENHLNKVYDAQNGKVIFDEDIVNILNALNDENEQLKKDIEYYKIERLALFEYLDKKDDLKLELKVEK